MTVSLCVVAYNEENFLPNLIEDFKLQTYPHELIEVILINSLSTDKTKQIMLDFAQSDNDFYSVKVYDNPKKIQASGWNIAIKNSTGDLIIRIDAHTHIPCDFTKLNVENIKTGEAVSGGIRPCLIENNNSWGRTLLQVENSLFGSSINKCRRSTEKTYVKTMFHAAYKREVFEKVGGFNENLLRTEDNEMHYRIRKAGYNLSFDPNIVSYQYARSSLKKMIKQKYGNGKWIALTLGVCPGCISLFHLVPFCFFISIIGSALLATVGLWQLAALIGILYFTFAVANTVISIATEGFSVYKLIMPLIFFVLHMAYGIGSLVGICQMPFMRKKLWAFSETEELKRA